VRVLDQHEADAESENGCGEEAAHEAVPTPGRL
jgi:hypothetical protein